MNIFRFHKFIADLKSISLSTQEKQDLRNDFLARTGIQVQPVSLFHIQMVRYGKLAAYSFLIFAIGITPFALAAEKSEPGDLLYPVKIAVNEPVKKTLQTFNPFDRADERRNERSLEEQERREELGIGTNGKSEERKEAAKVKLEALPAKTKANVQVPKNLPVQIPLPTDFPNVPLDVIPARITPVTSPAGDTTSVPQNSTIDKVVDDVIKAVPSSSAAKTIEKVTAPAAESVKTEVKKSLEPVTSSVNLSL